VQFLGTLSNADVSRYVSRCRALLSPGIEDFGIVAIEAAAAGRPTIAIRAGGAIETIVDGETGLFYEKQTPEHVADAIVRAERTDWDTHAIRKHALKFRPQVFRERVAQLLEGIGVSLDSATRT
jgi:glycosyltransferase involved in cell wall biosynthesis